jgi:tol-pal system protein YbgF
MHATASWRTGLGIAAVAAVLMAAAPARSQVWTGAGSADDLRYRLSVIDAELADIRARLGEAPDKAGGESSATAASGDLSVRIDRLEAELRRLTGKIEKIQFDQHKIAEDATRRFGDIEFRLTELEGGDTSALGPTPPLGGGQSGANKVAAAPQVSISERSDLDRAIEDVKQGRFDLGEDRLRSFLNDYPGSPLTGEAKYWLGESQFVRGAYKNAARSYLDGYNTDRTGPAAVQNLYRLGVTLGRLKQLNEACLTLREVRKEFPNGPADILSAADAESSSLHCR